MELNAFAYIRSIRNQAKKAYALAYLHFLQCGGEEPGHVGLGAMGAQAVRFRLIDIRDNNRKVADARMVRAFEEATYFNAERD